MTKAHRQEALSRAYVQAVAAGAGLSVGVPFPDYGIDMTLYRRRSVGGRRIGLGPSIDVQLRSSSRATFEPSNVVYDLDAVTYNLLRAPEEPGRPFLVLFVPPADEGDWIAQSERGLTVRGCAYWASLQGSPPSRARRSVRVRIPRANVFSVAGVRTLFENLGRRGVP